MRNALLAVLMAFTVTVTTPVAWWVGAPLRVAVAPEPGDAIVLLSSGQLDDTFLSVDGAQRVLGALDLYRRGFAPVIVSSGSSGGGRQAGLQADWLRRMGVPDAALIVEDGSSRTYGSVLAVRAMMATRGWRRVVFVTGDMDVPRLRAVARRAGVAASYLAVPAEAPPRGVLYLRSGMGVLWHAAYEYAGLALYWWRGWL